MAPHFLFDCKNSIMSFWNWIKSKITNTADTSLVVKSKGEGESHVQLEKTQQIPQRLKTRSKEEQQEPNTEIDNLQRLKQEYERLCSVLEHIKRKGKYSTILQTLPELPRLSYGSVSVKIYIPPKFEAIKTMAAMKEVRVEEEKYQLMMQEQEITNRLGMVSDYIGTGDYVSAQDALETAGLLINTIDSKEVELRYTKLSRLLKIREDEEKMLKIEKCAEEQRRKNKEKQEKAKYLAFIQSVNSRRKVGDSIVLRDFSDNGIACLYHFTSKANLKSIREKGGLYATAYHSKFGIVARGAVIQASQIKNNDVINFSEYVSLSICKEHFMARELYNAGVDVCVLKIRTDVVRYYKTYFTDIDTSNERFRIGKEFQDIGNINFNAVKDDKLTPCSANYAQKFAEVLVYAFIPLNLIENIDNPIKLK